MIKNYFFVSLLIFVFQSGFSQTEKTLKGKVMFDNFLLQNVDVINKTTQKSTTTDIKGEFVLSAKVNDSIIFYRKEYYLKGIQLSPNDIATNKISVSMVKKPEELEEIIIRQIPNIDWKLDTKWEQVKRDEITAERTENRLKNTRIDDLSIDKGLNLARIGKTIFKLLVKETSGDKAPQIEFKQLARSSCDEKFYLENLKLKPDEIDLFLQFCDADPKSKTLLENNNILSMMDFLYAKNIEFKKL
ncbi:hypothetical protein E0I26_05735 [Flavobacterium rhamnosiphilum]|uniref:CarboxypepD_reg-like domain-containing protein n=1 Tax=Flavobacterium rhamnosiphilum TaxID=2541724 RepID=A0A4R5F9U2_9FLAO|nr:hypothetical protein [Flavobacterium rhamnosiphilum]TDE45453.1 hypothetical protein E0I26_05735 [Flavobacterium rhamnosiphilum]